ncbi:hypothetical protein D1BOALGB6SA_10877 [Olavius sp. associated proteobacterium Delta 1]|nr:hypothetical protein D1BOALGB6SA_10877 [Olavius sp. associated proteobacterium Delta 1]
MKSSGISLTLNLPHGLRIRSPALYPAELRAHVFSEGRRQNSELCPRRRFGLDPPAADLRTFLRNRIFFTGFQFFEKQCKALNFRRSKTVRIYENRFMILRWF